MIDWKKHEEQDLTGKYSGEIVEVQAEPNVYYDPKRANSSEETLTITWQLEDPDSGDAIMHTQRFVSPIVSSSGKGLFTQLFNIVMDAPGADSGEFDEHSLIGLKMLVNIGKNKKGYATVETVESL